MSKRLNASLDTQWVIRGGLHSFCLSFSCHILHSCTFQMTQQQQRRRDSTSGFEFSEAIVHEGDSRNAFTRQLTSKKKAITFLRLRYSHFWKQTTAVLDFYFRFRFLPIPRRRWLIRQVAKVIWQRPNRIVSCSPSGNSWRPSSNIIFLEYPRVSTSSETSMRLAVFVQRGTDWQTPESSVARVRISYIRCGLLTYKLTIQRRSWSSVSTRGDIATHGTVRAGMPSCRLFNRFHLRASRLRRRRRRRHCTVKLGQFRICRYRYRYRYSVLHRSSVYSYFETLKSAKHLSLLTSEIVSIVRAVTLSVLSMGDSSIFTLCKNKYLYKYAQAANFLCVTICSL